MTAHEDWTIYETAPFCQDVFKYLTEFELEALRHQLVRVPFYGAYVSGLAPLMRFDFAGASVIYTIQPHRRLIALVQIDRSIGRPVDIEEAEKPQLARPLDQLRQSGYLAAGKQLAQWIIETAKSFRSSAD